MKLHLGCGDQIKEGWLNLDIQHHDSPHCLQWDLRDGLPSQAKDVTYVYSSHFLEHILWRDTLKLLGLCKDVMVSGGVMRHCIPNFRQLVTKYLEADWAFFGHCTSVAPNNQLMEIINYSLYQRDDGTNATHLTMFDPDYAVFTLQKVGFRNCRQVDYDPEIDWIARAPYSFFVEGIK